MTNQLKNPKAENQEPFIEMVNHELKSPLATIKISAELLQKAYSTTDHPKLIDSLKKIDSKVDTLTTLINDYTDLVRIQTKLLKFNDQKFLLSNLLSDFTVGYQPKTGSIKIINNTSPDVMVKIDFERFSQMMIGLILYLFRFSNDQTSLTIYTVQDGSDILFNLGCNLPKTSKEISENYFSPNKLTSPQKKLWSEKREVRINTILAEEVIRHSGGTFTVYSNKHLQLICSFSLPIVA